MISAQEAVQVLIAVNQGEYRETLTATTVREFTPMKQLPKSQFMLEAPLLEVVDKRKK